MSVSLKEQGDTHVSDRTSDALKVFLVGFTLFSVTALLRVVARDEGFYLMAAKLVSRGSVPYQDFFYPQGPILPLLYSLPFLFTPTEYLWEVGRITSALSAALSLSFLFVLLRGSISRHASLAVVSLFALSPICFGWLPVAKNYGWAVCFLLGALVFAERSSPTRAFLSGLFLSLGAQTRLLSVLFLPAFAPLILTRAARAPFIGGALVGCLPSLALLFKAPEQFLFGNIGYHRIRAKSDEGLSALTDKLHSFSRLFDTRQDLTAYEQQLLILCCFFFISVGFLVLTDRKSRWLAVGAFTLFAGSFVPTPYYLQYFAVCAPFMILIAAIASSKLRTFTGPYTVKVLGRSALLVSGLFVLLSLPSSAQSYLIDGRELTRKGRTKSLSLVEISRISSMLGQQTGAGEPAIALWPGHLLESELTPIPGLENQFSLLVGGKLSDEERRRLKLISYEELRAEIAQGSTRTLVVNDSILKRRHLRAPILKGGFKMLSRQRRTTIYQRESVADSASENTDD